MKKHHTILSVMTAAILLSGAPLAANAARLDITIAPPAPQVVVVPPARHGYVWAPGYWRWEGRHHVWVDGRWIRERRGQHWVPESWEHRGERYHFEPGHWERN